MQVFTNTMPTELFIHFITVTACIFLDNITKLVELGARLAEIDGNKHSLASDLTKSLDVIMNLSLFILDEYHRRVITMETVLVANNIDV